MLGNLILQGEDVVQVSVIPIGPEMVAAGRIKQPGDDPHPLVGCMHAALEYVLRSSLLAELMGADRLPWVGSGVVESDDEGSRELGEIRDQHFGDPSTKTFSSLPEI